MAVIFPVSSLNMDSLIKNAKHITIGTDKETTFTTQRKQNNISQMYFKILDIQYFESYIKGV
jgi:hypothetical protein